MRVVNMGTAMFYLYIHDAAAQSYADAKVDVVESQLGWKTIAINEKRPAGLQQRGQTHSHQTLEIRAGATFVFRICPF